MPLSECRCTSTPTPIWTSRNLTPIAARYWLAPGRGGRKNRVCGRLGRFQRAVLQLAENYDLLAAVGIHPNSTAEAAAGDWQRVVALVDHPRVVALGETGLDRYRDFAPLALQQEYLDRHLRLAQERDLPVIIHCRDAAAELMPMLRAAAARGPLRGVLHAFSGDAAWAAECVALGLHVSFAGNVTYSNKKFDPLRAAARTVPADRLLDRDRQSVPRAANLPRQTEAERAGQRGPHGRVSGRTARRAGRADRRPDHGQRPAAVPPAVTVGLAATRIMPVQSRLEYEPAAIRNLEFVPGCGEFVLRTVRSFELRHVPQGE